MFPPFLGVGFPDPKPTNLGVTIPGPTSNFKSPKFRTRLKPPMASWLGTRKQTCGVFVKGAWRKHTNHKQNHPQKNHPREATHPFS